MDCSTPASSVLYYLPVSAQIHVYWVSDAIQPSYLLTSFYLFAFNPSHHQCLFQGVSSSLRWSKYHSFRNWLSKEDLGLIFFKIDSFDCLAVLKSLLQHPKSKTSSLLISLLYCLTLTSVYDHWKNHSFDYRDFCQ